MDKKIMDSAADNIRVLVAAMVEKANSGHPGGAMGAADFVNVLYSSYLVTDPDDPTWIARDRFFLDPGHMSPMLYSVLALCGYYTLDELQQFRQWGSITPGHPELDPAHGVENTSGPLGQGHTMAVGAAIAERFLATRFGDWISHKTYAFISDGGIQEEISQGAGRIAGYLGLSNLIMFFDSNRCSSPQMSMKWTRGLCRKIPRLALERHRNRRMRPRADCRRPRPCPSGKTQAHTHYRQHRHGSRMCHPRRRML